MNYLDKMLNINYFILKKSFWSFKFHFYMFIKKVSFLYQFSYVNLYLLSSLIHPFISPFNYWKINLYITKLLIFQ